MASKMGLISCLMVAATLLMGAAADNHVVLDSLGWVQPPLGNIAYRNWASRQDFELGDTLEFRWNGSHTVARVSQEEYDNCTAINPIGQISSASPVIYTINSTETHYFICTIHCDMGQKLRVTIGTSAAAASLTSTALFALVFATAISFFTFM